MMKIRFNRVACIYAYFLASIFLLFGGVTLISPDVMGYYKIALEEPEARIAIRSIIGGGELALGILGYLGGRIRLSVSQRNTVFGTILLLVGVIRLASGVAEGIDHLSLSVLRESIIEMLLGVIALTFANTWNPKVR